MIIAKLSKGCARKIPITYLAATDEASPIGAIVKALHRGINAVKCAFNFTNKAVIAFAPVS